MKDQKWDFNAKYFLATDLMVISLLQAVYYRLLGFH
jgi:hypothetical protein